ncbi:MAG: HAMP domain-containing histidine kinase [Halothiobacillus sp.]|nr:HAMP domain-containing histidine kinase [Halothiobacillus sp.]
MRLSELIRQPGMIWRRFRRLLRTSVFRLALLFAIAFSVVVGVSLAGVYWLSTQYIVGQIDVNLQDELTQLRGDIGEGNSKDSSEGLIGQIRERVSQNDKSSRLYLLVDANRHILAGNLLGWPKDLTCGEPAQFSDQSDIVPKNRQAEDSDIRVRALSTQLPDGRCLLVGQAMIEEEGFTDHTGYLLTWALGIITLFSLAGGGWMGLAVLRRIDTITHTATQIMAGEFSRRIPDEGKGDEFSDLSARLNQMLDRIDELMAGMRSVTDNIAHDLRSPLTRLRNRLEISLTHDRPADEYREVMQQTMDDADQLLALFNTLIAIAQAEAGVRREVFTTVDFSSLLLDLVDFYQLAAEDRGIHLSAQIQPGITRLASQGLLTQIVVNLLENALNHIPAGSKVAVTLAQQDKTITLTIADNGPGIPNPADRLRVLERFVRLDTARSSPGSGLGLALVRAAMHEQGGTVELHDNHPGLKVVLTFPCQTEL